MSKLYSRVLPASRIRLHALAAALALATLASAQAQAARLGSARVLSAQGSTLNVTATYTQLTPEEASTLKVTLADADAWARAGLTPPATLASMRVELEPPVGRAQAASARVIRVTSSEPSTAQTVDLLFDVSTSSGQRQVQLSVLAPQPGLSRPAAPTPAFVPKAQPRSAPTSQALAAETPRQAAPSADAGARGAVVVQRNQNLSGIVQRYPVADATYYQELVALWQANPSAFIENNMNLVREGERLTIPSAAAVRAVDPAQAQRLYNEHLEAHALYRSRMAGSVVGGRAVAGGPTASGEVGAGSAPVIAGVQTAQDRLRLSSGQGDGSTGAGSASTAAGDQRSSEALALKDANDRVNQLQRNVDDLKSAANATAGGAVIGGTTGGTGTGAAGAPGVSGATGAGGPTGGSGSASAAGSAGASGATGASGAAGAPGAPGSTGAAGATGVPGAAGIPGASGALGSSGSGATLGGLAGGGVSGAAANSASSGKSGTSNNTSGGTSSSDSTSSPGASSPGTSGTPSLMSQSGLPAWLTDNLLIVVTGILAIIAFIIAWVVRRAAARRDDDSDSDNDSGDDEPSDRTVDPALIDKRLGEIDLDLNNPPNDGKPFDNRRA